MKKSSQNREERILGIDPGFGLIGWAVINKKKKIIDYGSISTPAKDKIEDRLVEIATDIKKIINTYQPTVLAIEKLFYFKNAKTIINVAQSRGVVVYLAAAAGLKIAEYTPLEIKMTIAGYGQADKLQVQKMVVSLLHLPEIPRPDDVADALAVAYTHLVYSHNRAFLARL